MIKGEIPFCGGKIVDVNRCSSDPSCMASWVKVWGRDSH